MNYNEAMQYIESLGKFGIHLGMGTHHGALWNSWITRNARSGPSI